ncbi:MAG: hypothetical protein M3297_08615 [Thermoproteota archaeon]|nr:hypothetical protein [Thermoproteota archaeon]
MRKHFVHTIAVFSVIILLFSVFDMGLRSIVPTIIHAQASKDKVFVMYAASLIKTFEETLGPTF